MNLQLADPATGELATTPRQRALAEREAIIVPNLKAFIQVGMQLIAIRDDRLYADDYPSFTAYLKERWNFSRSHAYHLISAGLLSDAVDVDIPTERVARAVTDLPAADRAPVLVLAHVAAEASHVKLDSGWIVDAAAIYHEVRTTGGQVDDGEGGMSNAVAGVIEARHERLKRKEQHLSDAAAKASGVTPDDVKVDIRGARVSFVGQGTIALTVTLDVTDQLKAGMMLDGVVFIKAVSP